MSFRLVETPLGILPPLSPPARGGEAASLPLEAFLPSAAAEAAVARLKRPGALAVTTGQQPGLFGGPLYSVHKALSAAALAAELEAAWDRPVVPVFWLAGDDHHRRRFRPLPARQWHPARRGLTRPAALDQDPGNLDPVGRRGQPWKGVHVNSTVLQCGASG